MSLLTRISRWIDTVNGGIGRMVGWMVLAMVAVGLFATRMQGASRVAVPGAFVLAMIVGALAGAGGVFMPLQEAGIAVAETPSHIAEALFRVWTP